MKRELWLRMIRGLELGLSVFEIARRLETSYASAWRWCREFRYPAVDQRRFHKRKMRKFDWSKTDTELARKHQLSRQRINYLRHRDLKKT